MSGLWLRKRDTTGTGRSKKTNENNTKKQEPDSYIWNYDIYAKSIIIASGERSDMYVWKIRALPHMCSQLYSVCFKNLNVLNMTDILGNNNKFQCMLKRYLIYKQGQD